MRQLELCQISQEHWLTEIDALPRGTRIPAERPFLPAGCWRWAEPLSPHGVRYAESVKPAVSEWLLWSSVCRAEFLGQNWKDCQLRDSVTNGEDLESLTLMKK